jgi:hypothetical protein
MKKFMKFLFGIAALCTSLFSVVGCCALYVEHHRAEGIGIFVLIFVLSLGPSYVMLHIEK